MVTATLPPGLADWREASRVRAMNERQLAPDARYVLCWLQRALRARDNPVIDAAVRLGNALGLPVLADHGVREDYPTPRTGSISRTGDAIVRSYVFEAVNVRMTRGKRWTGLKAWGVKLAGRTGTNRARAAVARKMGLMMHKMLITNTEFRWGKEEA